MIIHVYQNYAICMNIVVMVHVVTYVPYQKMDWTDDILRTVDCKVENFLNRGGSLEVR